LERKTGKLEDAQICAKLRKNGKMFPQVFTHVYPISPIWVNIG
jgi:hypothetical protein